MSMQAQSTTPSPLQLFLIGLRAIRAKDGHKVSESFRQYVFSIIKNAAKTQQRSFDKTKEIPADAICFWAIMQFQYDSKRLAKLNRWVQQPFLSKEMADEVLEEMNTLGYY